MIKKCLFYTSLALIIAFLSSSFKTSDLALHKWFLISNAETSYYLFPSQIPQEYNDLNVPYTGKYFIGYKEAIAFKESQGQYKKINSLGYLGKYQFGKQTLKTIGVENTNHFLNNPKIQEKAFETLLSKNKAKLSNIIDKYDGHYYSGIFVTESGILAAAHLGGVGSVKKFFKNNGKRYFRDAYGTSITTYLKDFSGYDTSNVIADSNANVN